MSHCFISHMAHQQKKSLQCVVFEVPTTPSAGIPHVIVNGVFVVRDGDLVKEARPGSAVIVTP